MPTLVQREQAKWLLRENGEDVADQVIAFTEKCAVPPRGTRCADSTSRPRRWNMGRIC